MGRELPASEAPLLIRTAWDTLLAQAGYMICFDAGDTVRESLYSYAHWPVRPDHFHNLYKAWDAPDCEPTPAQSHLLSLGCKPYSRSVLVWAKKLEQATTVQSIESRQPVVVPAGAWLCMGANGSASGAPYSMATKHFVRATCWKLKQKRRSFNAVRRCLKPRPLAVHEQHSQYESRT